jgi:hypothetical protein
MFGISVIDKSSMGFGKKYDFGENAYIWGTNFHIGVQWKQQSKYSRIRISS